MFIIPFLAIVTTLFAGWRAVRRLRYFLHVFQLHGYKSGEFRAWVAHRFRTLVFRFSHKLALAELVLVAIAAAFLAPFPVAAVALLLWAVTFASSRRYRSDREKKTLKYTNRMQRLLAIAALLAILPIAGGLYIWLRGDLADLIWYLGGLFLADFLAPAWVLVAAALMHPVERRIREGFKRQARRRFSRRSDLKIIAVTGSYGKTSTKTIIGNILGLRYQTLITPGSYNTPMGLCLVVNNMLRAEHQVLVLEMGIRYPGDMDELCGLVRPHIGVVTSIGVAHLESMGTVDRIADEKARMIANMDAGGVAVLNMDDDRVVAMTEQARGRIWRISAQGRPGADLAAFDIRYDHRGTFFLVRDRNGAEQRFRTRLLGAHNVTNILLALAVGCEMGLRLRQMTHAVEQIEPVPHRLQLRREGPVTIIDDAFNANPVGALNAVEILGTFRSGRRIIVTPGMIELGERQHEENRLLGEHIADHADLALLVGRKQTAPIREGLQTKNFPAENLHVFDALRDAQTFLASFLREGDVVLYENDLPDQYDE